MVGGGLGSTAGTLAEGLPTHEEALLEILADIVLVANEQDLEARTFQLYQLSDKRGGHTVKCVGNPVHVRRSTHLFREPRRNMGHMCVEIAAAAQDESLLTSLFYRHAYGGIVYIS